MLSEEHSATEHDQRTYPGVARTLTGVVSPCSPLISELIATFLGPALGWPKTAVGREMVFSAPAAT
jgi:hypothetical protein